MDPVKQIKAVAQTYLQEQQLKEQAEYISVLEHTIEVIAEELGVPPQQLINEISVMGRAASAFKAAREGGSGVLGAGIQAVKAGAGALKANMRQAGGQRIGSHGISNIKPENAPYPLNIPTAGARMAGVARMAGTEVGLGQKFQRVATNMASSALGREAMGVGNNDYGSNAGDIQKASKLYGDASKDMALGHRTKDRLHALDRKDSPKVLGSGDRKIIVGSRGSQISSGFARGVEDGRR